MNQKLSKNQIQEINDLYWIENKSSRDIAKDYPVNFNHIQRVCYKDKPNGVHVRSFKSHVRKLSEYQVKKILIDRIENGTDYKTIAKKYKVTPENIGNICRGRSWKHVFQKAQEKYNLEILSISKKD